MLSELVLICINFIEQSTAAKFCFLIPKRKRLRPKCRPKSRNDNRKQHTNDRVEPLLQHLGDNNRQHPLSSIVPIVQALIFDPVRQGKWFMDFLYLRWVNEDWAARFMKDLRSKRTSLIMFGMLQFWSSVNVYNPSLYCFLFILEHNIGSFGHSLLVITIRKWWRMIQECTWSHRRKINQNQKRKI